MEGSVLFGLNPNKITIRIAKYTKGIAIKKKWVEEKHSYFWEKEFDEKRNINWCINCFSKFKEINQKL